MPLSVEGSLKVVPAKSAAPYYLGNDAYLPDGCVGFLTVIDYLRKNRSYSTKTNTKSREEFITNGATSKLIVYQIETLTIELHVVRHFLL